MESVPNPFGDRLGEIEGEAASQANASGEEHLLAGPQFFCEICGKPIDAPPGTLRRWCGPACKARKGERRRLIKKLRKVHEAKRRLVGGTA